MELIKKYCEKEGKTAENSYEKLLLMNQVRHILKNQDTVQVSEVKTTTKVIEKTEKKAFLGLTIPLPRFTENIFLAPFITIYNNLQILKIIVDWRTALQRLTGRA